MSAQTGARPTERSSGQAVSRRGRVAASVLLGCAAIAVLVVARVDALPLLLPRLRDWDVVVADALVDNVHGMWRVMRGGIKFLLAPALVVAVGLCLVHLVRHGRARSAAVAFVVAVGAYGTVELLKAGVVPDHAWMAGGTQPHMMSGHVAALSAALVPVAVATGPRAGRVVAVLGVVLVTGAAIGVVLARWHTVTDGLGSMVVVAMWSAVAAAVVRVATRGRPDGPAAAQLRLRRRVALVGAVLAVAAALVLAVVAPSSDHTTTGMVAAVILFAGVAALTVEDVLWLGAALTVLDAEPTEEER